MHTGAKACVSMTTKLHSEGHRRQKRGDFCRIINKFLLFYHSQLNGMFKNHYFGKFM